jgi:hypothetical protein
MTTRGVGVGVGVEVGVDVGVGVDVAVPVGIGVRVWVGRGVGVPRWTVGKASVAVGRTVGVGGSTAARLRRTTNNVPPIRIAPKTARIATARMAHLL